MCESQSALHDLNTTTEFDIDFVGQVYKGRHQFIVSALEPALLRQLGQLGLQGWATVVFINSDDEDPTYRIQCAVEAMEVLSTYNYINNIIVMNNYHDSLDNGKRAAAWDMAVCNGLINTLSVMADTTMLEDTGECHRWVVGTVVQRL